MNNSWRTRADVLKDIGAVTGRRMGVEDLHLHVVEGERPPPIRHETPDENELKYFTGGLGCSATDDGRGPDLDGISAMLQMVNVMDETVDRNEPMTLYHNRATDKISISKLNPSAGEYVPGRQFNGGSRQTNMQANVLQYRNATNSFNNMFKSRNISNSASKSPSKNLNTVPSANHSPLTPNIVQPETKDMLSPRKITEEGNGISKTQEKISRSPSKVANKADEIKKIKEEIKSTIIASSKDNSLKTKRQKNVAIATLLKMGAITSAAEETPVKLIKPDYFENPPKTGNKVEETPVNGSTEEEIVVPSTSSSELELNYVDPDSISKVTGWFNSIESPKPKPQPQIQPKQKPLVLKEAITFKKKSNSSASSHISEASKEKKEPVKEPSTAFEPSSYADELLKKYESNAKQATSREDLGTRLERQLRERDEVIRLKLARQNAG